MSAAPACAASSSGSTVSGPTVGASTVSDGRFVEYRKTRSRRVRDELVEAHLPLARFLASRFAQRGEPMDDLVQVALLGLVKAVERFDPFRGLRFSTFATPTIVGELKRHFRDRGWAVHVPRRVQELHVQLPKVVGTLSQVLGRSPTTSEVAESTGASEEDVLEAMEAGTLYRLASLDAPSGNDDEAERATTIGTADPEFETLEERLDIARLLDVLPQRERRIVYLRFFEGLTQSEIADKIGISQMHVSRLLTRSLEVLRKHANESVRS
jgi:RNA polymerase sigma-B factor